MIAVVRRQLLTTLSLYRSLPRARLVAVAQSHPGCDWSELVELVLDSLIDEGSIAQTGDVLSHVERQEIIPANYLQAADNYRKARETKQTIGARLAVFFARFLHRCWGGLFLISAVSITLALCVLLTPKAHGVEVPDAIIRALVMVESGATWKNTGDISGDWARGKAGEISHFQLSRAAIADMGATNKAARIASCPVLAESLARLWLSRCYACSGNWPETLARYNAGSRYRSRAARDYSARVLALSSL